MLGFQGIVLRMTKHLSFALNLDTSYHDQKFAVQQLKIIRFEIDSFSGRTESLKKTYEDFLSPLQGRNHRLGNLLIQVQCEPQKVVPHFSVHVTDYRDSLMQEAISGEWQGIDCIAPLFKPP